MGGFRGCYDELSSELEGNERVRSQDISFHDEFQGKYRLFGIVLLDPYEEHGEDKRQSC